ncbi:hypothetical protein TNCV_468621 [Trichonephila clavipes]|nr:hypothetical protein TNCV_468621 [Trichonephila clavipes]
MLTCVRPHPGYRRGPISHMWLSEPSQMQDMSHHQSLRDARTGKAQFESDGILNSVVFQPGETSPHFDVIIRNYINHSFPGRGSLSTCAPRPFDLTPHGFITWGHKNSLVYRTKVTSSHQLHARIEQIVSSITHTQMINFWMLHTSHRGTLVFLR